MRLYTVFFSISFLVLVSFVEVFAQNQSERYWFVGGGSRGIRFDQPSNNPTLINKTAVAYGTGGSAVATDAASGTLLFYTDGTTVYDINHAPMLNGTGLAGDPSRGNPAVVCPVPGQPDLYYIFTNSAAGVIQFSIVDMTQGGVFPGPPTGIVNPPVNQNTTIPPGQAEGMIIIPHSNGTDYWLITQTEGTTDYTVTQIQPGGVFTSTTYSNVGVNISAASFTYNAVTGQLAVAPQNANTNVAILNFDTATGQPTFVTSVVNSGVSVTGPMAISDVAWSPNGQYLYVSVHGDAGPPPVVADVLQFDLTNPTLLPISILPQPGSAVESHGLQTGPDGAIYHLYETAGGSILMGKITDADSIGTAVTYTPQAFPGNINFNATQFPSFSPAPNLNLTVSFTSSGTCTNTPISFFPTVTPGADSLVWDFGDGTVINSWSPVHTFQSTPAAVTVVAYLNGQTDTASVNLNLTQFDLQINLVQDTVACICEFKPPVGSSCNGGPFQVTAEVQGGAATYQWFGPDGEMAGQTNTSLTPDSAGYYFIKATIGGCSTFAGVNIRTYDSLDQRANIWHFGQSAGIDFNVPYYNPSLPPAPITGPDLLDAPHGVATISDRNGQVIFTTDGRTVYDRTGTPLPDNLGGSPNSTQSALIVPVPGDETLYYIFTTQAVEDGTGTYELRYSIFDLKLNPIGTNGGGLVDLDTSTPAMDASLVLYDMSTERLTGNAGWVISHDYGTNCFRAFQVTQNGIGGPVVSCLGSDHSIAVPENAEGYMKLGPNNMLAVALSDPGNYNIVELFDFVDSTGVVTNFRSVDVGTPDADDQVYGIEFSGNKMFTTLTGATSHIVEIFFDSLSMPHVIDQNPIPPYNGQLGAIQTGPDGQVYVAINGYDHLGTITVDGDTTRNSSFDADGFPLISGTTNSTLGLPNFIQSIGNPTQGPTIVAEDGCVNTSISFTASGKEQSLDQFDWFFGDGSSLPDGGPQVSHTYSSPGNYTVSVFIHNKCELPPPGISPQPQPVTITIHANPLPADDLLNAPPLCTGAVTLDANPAGIAGIESYAWSTGPNDTLQTLTVNAAGAYTVTLTNQFGCSSNRTIQIGDDRPTVDLPANQFLCQNAPIDSLDAGNPTATYQWEINDVPSATTRRHFVNTSVPGQFEYEVVVVHPFTPDCFAFDSVIFTINPIPQFTASAGPMDADCTTADGQINITISGSPPNDAGPFDYTVAGPSGSNGVDLDPGDVASVTGLAAGTYSVFVRDQVSNCAAPQTVSINDVSLAVAGIPDGPLCDPIEIRVTTNTAPGATHQYRVINASTGAVEIPLTTQVSPPTGNPFLTSGVPSGNYIVEVTALGCVSSSAVIPVQQNGPDITFVGPDLCVDGSVSVATAPAATTFAWSSQPAGGIASDPTLSTVTLNPGDWTLTVTATDGSGGCNTESTTITADINTPPTLTADEPCTDNVFVTATPGTGPYLYNWFVNGTADTNLSGPRVIATVTASYRIDMVNRNSGCQFSSPEISVPVLGEMEIEILPMDQACEGSPFTINTSASQPGATYSWTYNGTPISGASAASLTVTDQAEGIYAVLASIGTCTDEDDINVNIAPSTTALLNDLATICDDESNTDTETNQVILYPGPGFRSFTWFQDGNVLTNETDSAYVAMESGLYRVELVNFFGCPASDETRIVTECAPRIVGPNAFRPGGLNREFFLFTFFIADTDFQVFIFNRWGEMVYQSNERAFRWNGSYKNDGGQPLPPGTYTYVVKYRGQFEEEKGVQEKRGGVVLLR